jgi:penicillin-binding protein 1B
LGCELDEADAAGIALLVGLIRAPNATSPFANPERARERRDLVLRLMRENGLLTDEEHASASARPLAAKQAPRRNEDAAYFLDAVRRELERRGAGDLSAAPGTRIFTTLDLRDQTAAGEAVVSGLAELERRYPRLRRPSDPLQAAAVVIDPASGEVRALVGGRDYLRSPYDRASVGSRQPGSLFKPFVYLTAFAHRREDGESWTAATRLEDEPLVIEAGRRPWRPENYDREFRGEVTAREALEQSLNVPTVRLAQELGAPAIVETAQRLGITSPLQEVPSLPLGTSEVTLLEITGAYAALAAGGEARVPTFVRAVEGGTGEAVRLADGVEAMRPEGVSVPHLFTGMEAAPVFVTTSLLRGVIDDGTGRGARSAGVRGPVAGKTGTTDGYRDAWFVGYSRSRTAGVWVGFDREGRLGLSGSQAALPMWSSLMRSILRTRGDGPFPEPEDVVTLEVDPETGLRATDRCPRTREEVFVAGTEPREECRHGGGLFGWIKRFFSG